MKRWTKTSDEYLRKYAGRKGWDEIAGNLGVSREAARRRFYRIGLKIPNKRLKVDYKAKEMLKEKNMCSAIKVPVCAPTKVIMINGKRTEVWGKPSFIQKLEARR